MGNTGKQPKRGRPAKREKSSDAKTVKTVKQNARTGGDEIQKKEKVTAYMATFPTRELIIAEAVESLLPQVDKLVIWVNGEMELPQACYHEKVELYWGKDVLGFDIGCAGKFAFAFEWEGYIFTVDDDIVYAPDYVEKSIAKIEEYNRECIFSYHGRITKLPITTYRSSKDMVKNCSFQQDVGKDTECHVIGTGVMFFHADTIFPKYDIMEMKHTNVSDIHFAQSMDMRGIRTIVAEHQRGWLKALNPIDGISHHKETDKFHCDLINVHPWRELKN
ncbi:MAG: hypothetical protein WBL58_09255 [Peptococcia bacterium]